MYIKEVGANSVRRKWILSTVSKSKKRLQPMTKQIEKN